MKIKKIILLYIIIVYLIGLTARPASSQIVLKIKYQGDLEQVAESKKLLRKFSVSFDLGDETIFGEMLNDSSLILLNVDTLSRSNIADQDFVLTRLERKNECYYTLVASDFVTSKMVRDFRIYKVQLLKHVVGGLHILRKSKTLASTIHFNYMGINWTEPIKLISCHEYSNDYDNFINGNYEYFDWKPDKRNEVIIYRP